MAPGRLAVGSLCVALVFATGYLRTHDAAERLTRTSSRPHPVNAAEVQQVLDMARFTATAPAGAPSGVNQVMPAAAPVVAVPVMGHGTAAPPQAVESSRTSGPAPAGPGVPPAGVADPIASQPGTASAPAAGLSSIVSAVVDVPAAPAPAAEGAAPAAPVTPPPPAPLRDGTYTGWGYCRHGEIQATLIVEHGRVTSAEITGCYTRYSCDWIAKLPPQVVSRQSAEVDFVSGATESADAFYFAVEEALKKAR